jgi:hypothetical protein
VRRIWMLLLGVGLLVACAPLSASDASAPGGAAAKKRVKIAGAGQRSILKRGIKLKVRGPGRFSLKATSTTFDDGNTGALTRKRKVRIGRGGHVLRLKLTRSGRRRIKSCEARTIKVKRGGKRRLVRDTAACRPQQIDLTRASECDFIGQQAGSRCLLPFPDDFYTAADSKGATGRRVALRSSAMPRNTGNTPINPADYNVRDGFSPGSTILLKVPGLDTPAAMQQTGAVAINHIGRYADPDQPFVVIDAATGRRQPIWAEIDSNASTAAGTAVEIHPATNFASGHRYIVALRNLKTASGAAIPAPEGFRYYRDQLPSKQGAINVRRSGYETLFETLRSAGIRRSTLYIAWDFTVASDEDTARQMLHMRDDAFAQLGDTNLADLTPTGAAPAFTVTTVDDFPDGTGPGEDPNVARRVRGTFTVPCYLAPSCAPGGRFNLDGAGLPVQNGTWSANFDCIIPRVAIDGGSPTPGRASTYGHGLFGSASEVFSSGIQKLLANSYGFTFCATDEIGMSGSDVGITGGAILPNLSNFPMLADRLHQGLLNGLFLGRLMISPTGFISDSAFHVDGVSTGSGPVIDTSHLYYEGSSQGGIFGGALTAIAPDFTRAVLNVPAMNYSVLLPRSVDYDAFAPILNASYTDELTRPLLLSLIQMLWDRSEPDGYAHRMTTNPLAGTPAHRVLMNVALGDHQVTNFQADVEARTIGASTHVPILYPGRWPDEDVLWNVPPIASYPFDGSAVVYGDIGPVRPNDLTVPPPANIGVPPPPLGNVPNRDGEDPHGAPRGAPLALALISEFLKPDGAVTNPCGATACFAGGFTGP